MKIINIMYIISSLLIIYILIRKNNNIKLINNIIMSDSIYIGSEGNGSDGTNTINYIMKLAYPDKNILWVNDDRASIIIKSNFPNLEKLWNKNNKPYIYWSGEVYNPPKSSYANSSISIQTINANHNNSDIFYIPYCAERFDFKNPIKKYEFNINRKFLAYCNSNPVQFRDNFVDLLAEKDKTNGVFALGRCVGKSPKINKKKIEGTHLEDGIINEYSNYAFIICMENQIENGYVTEKIINGFKSGAIPIYWGDPITVKKIFNENAFICVNDFPNIESCANYIIELFNDKVRLQNMANESVFSNNIIPDIMQIGNYENPPKYYLEIANKVKQMIENNTNTLINHNQKTNLLQQSNIKKIPIVSGINNNLINNTQLYNKLVINKILRK
jgi:hypothetical protein